MDDLERIEQLHSEICKEIIKGRLSTDQPIVNLTNYLKSLLELIHNMNINKTLMNKRFILIWIKHSYIWILIKHEY